MAARQLWLFLSAQDVSPLLARIAAREDGLAVSEGRYLRGDAGELLGDAAKLERREALPNERRIYLFHKKHSQDVLAHEQPMGPFAGWSQIDEERSDCLVLRMPIARGTVLEPSRLYAHTSYWRAGDKLRKRAPFALWANQTLRWLTHELPATNVKIMRAAPDALARAIAGELKLTYLYRTIAPLPSSSASQATSSSPAASPSQDAPSPRGPSLQEGASPPVPSSDAE